MTGNLETLVEDNKFREWKINPTKVLGFAFTVRFLGLLCFWNNLPKQKTNCIPYYKKKES